MLSNRRCRKHKSKQLLPMRVTRATWTQYHHKHLARRYFARFVRHRSSGQVSGTRCSAFALCYYWCTHKRRRVMLTACVNFRSRNNHKLLLKGLDDRRKVVRRLRDALGVSFACRLLSRRRLLRAQTDARVFVVYGARLSNAFVQVYNVGFAKQVEFPAASSYFLNLYFVESTSVANFYFRL